MAIRVSEGPKRALVTGAGARLGKAMAEALGHSYLYGVEFFEMDLGGPIERALCKDDHNALGFHGNAILSAVPAEATALIRLPEPAYWFVPGTLANADEPRVGARMAVAAILPGRAGAVCVVSVHLESNADAAYRARQFSHLLDEIDAFAPDLPVLIGGDQSVPYGRVYEAMVSLQKAGVPKVGLMSDPLEVEP